MKKWKTFNVAGVTFKNKPSDTMNRLDMIGKYTGYSSTFRLEREPENEFDSNAIAVRQVFHSGGSIVLGYVPKKVNVEFAPLMDAGWVPDIKFGRKFVDDATGECRGLQLRYETK